MTLLVVIVLFLVEHYLFVGVALGSWAVVMQLVMPSYRAIRYLCWARSGRRTFAPRCYPRCLLAPFQVHSALFPVA